MANEPRIEVCWKRNCLEIVLNQHKRASDYWEFHFTFSIQLSRVVNHTLFQAIIGMKLPTFYQQIANTLLTDHWQSTNSRSTVGQQMSYRKLSFQKNLNKSVGQLSVRCWSTVGQLLANSRLTDRRESAHRLSTVSRQITNSQPTVGEGSCYSQLPSSQWLKCL